MNRGEERGKLEKKFYENSVPRLTLDSNNRVIGVNRSAYSIFKEFKWRSKKELNKCLEEYGKMALDRVFYAKREKGIETDLICRLGIKTEDNRWLTLYNLNTYLENGYSILTFEKAKAIGLEKRNGEADICFKAPKDFNCKIKPWISYVINYCIDNLDLNSSQLEHKVEIDMTDVEKISEEIIELMNILKHRNLIISNPKPEIFDKLAANKFPKENIIGYELKLETSIK